MDKISELIKAVKKKFFKKKGEDEGESFEELSADMERELTKGEEAELATGTPEAEDDMLKGKHKKIMGLSRPVVFGIFGVLFLVFMGALMFNVSDSGSDQKDSKQTQKTTQQIAGEQTFKGSDSDKLSDDYGELQRANAKKAQGNANQTVQAQKTSEGNGNSTAPASNTVRPATSNSQLPAVPRTNPVVAQTPQVPASYSQPYSLPSQAQPAQAPVPAQSNNSGSSQSAAQALKQKLESAIEFALGTGGSKTEATAETAGGSDTPSTSGTATAEAAAPAYMAPAPNVVTAGTLIPVMLLTGINTDSPAQVMAQVMGDVYSVDGENLLIPAGSRILGKMDSTGKANASGRVSVTFDQLVMPDGGTWNIGKSMVAVDGAGYTGIQGNLHRHTGTNIARGLINSALSALSTINVDKVEISANDVLPTLDAQSANITVDPGYQFTVYVTENIAF